MRQSANMAKKGAGRERTCFWPAIGVVARKATQVRHQSQRFDVPLAELTWASVDRAIWAIANGTPESLADMVADPESFKANLHQTVIVAKDETPVWLKLRGEEKICASREEIQRQYRRRSLARTVQSSTASPEAVAAAETALAEHLTEFPNQILEFGQTTTQGGDKYRLTVITIQAVKNWFNPDAQPVGEMPRQILIVPCQTHARLEHIDQNGCWAQTVPSFFVHSGRDLPWEPPCPLGVFFYRDIKKKSHQSDPNEKASVCYHVHRGLRWSPPVG